MKSDERDSEKLEAVGTVVSVLGNNNFLVEIERSGSQHRILGHLSGNMRRFKIGVVAGDTVTIEIPPPYDKGRIVFRGEKD